MLTVPPINYFTNLLFNPLSSIGDLQGSPSRNEETDRDEALESTRGSCVEADAPRVVAQIAGFDNIYGAEEDIFCLLK